MPSDVEPMDAIREYYRLAAERERRRLDRSTAGRIELAVNLAYVRRYLPPGSRVLDIGGGTGPYTRALAAEGHRVTLADLSPELLALAREELAGLPEASNVEAVVEADASDLSRFAAASFDAVLSLGPFYHLIRAQDRREAVMELGRVLRPGGCCFVATMPLTTLLKAVVAEAAARREYEPSRLPLALATGEYVADRPGRFTQGYYFHPDELEGQLAMVGIETLHLVASEGVAALLDEHAPDVWSEGLAFAELLEVCLTLAEQPAALGAGTHALLVGRKSA